jgi:hypothetical protein
MGAPSLPGFGRCGNAESQPAAFVSGHDTMGAPSLPGFGRCGNAESQTFLCQGTTQWVPHLCPVLADVGMRNLKRFCVQGTTQWVPHICSVLADVGMQVLNLPLLYQGTTSVVPKKTARSAFLAAAGPGSPARPLLARWGGGRSWGLPARRRRTGAKFRRCSQSEHHADPSFCLKPRCF